MSDDPKDPRDENFGSEDEDWFAPDEDENAKRWQRPTGDRFPALPDEEAPPPTAPLREPPPRRPKTPPPQDTSGRDRGRNLVSLFFILATILVVVYFVIVWQNPYSTLNPLAPPTPLPLMITATYTPTDIPSATPTPMPSPTLTATPTSPLEATATFTPIFLEGFSTPPGTPGTPTPTDDPSLYRFGLQNNRLVFITNPDARGGCNWSSIAGSVMNYDGSALNGYGVHVVGEGVDVTVATGSASGFGPGGFEVPLGNVARRAQYIAQLLDEQGRPVSPVYTVETSDDCTLNIAALRFVETAPSS